MLLKTLLNIRPEMKKKTWRMMNLIGSCWTSLGDVSDVFEQESPSEYIEEGKVPEIKDFMFYFVSKIDCLSFI